MNTLNQAHLTHPDSGPTSHTPIPGISAQDLQALRSASDLHRLETIKRAFEMRGYRVLVDGKGGYGVARWKGPHPCPDIDALAAYAKEMGVMP